MQNHSIPRVLHIPCHTPYVRKLSGPLCRVVNGAKGTHSSVVPDHASLSWLRQQSSLSFFDLIHIHFFEAEPVETICHALERCTRERKAIVLTVHDLCPVFSQDTAAFKERLSVLCSASNAIIALTPESAERLEHDVGKRHSNKIAVIPHGYVLHPEHKSARCAGSRNGLVEFALFGSLRANRATFVTVANWLLAIDPSVARLNLLLRPLGPDDPETERSEARTVLALLQHNTENINAVITSIPDDDALASFLTTSDVLIMPYTRGTHSGQLELAFDLGMVPLITTAGFYADQWEYARAHVQEPVWVDWADGARHLYGSRLVDAFSTAIKQVHARNTRPTADSFKAHRLTEHNLILAAYRDLYSKSLAVAGTFN